MRLLVPIRVSRDVAEGSSPEDQRDVALGYEVEHPGTRIIFTNVVDYEVSGATLIADRAGVREWLQPERINEWDAIGGAEMSRISRDLYDYLGFFRNLVQERGKIVVDLSDGTDSFTLRGRQTLENRILEAQRYREFVGEKRARKAARLSDLGQWDGGRIPFGYRPVQREFTDDFGRDRKGWFLIKDEEGTTPVVLRMVDGAFAGKSQRGIAGDLAEEEVLSPLGKPIWRDSTVNRILRSPTLAGFVVKMEGAGKNKNHQAIRRDRNGEPIRFTDEPIITEDRWRNLQDVLNARGRVRGGPQSRHALWNVAFCRNCSVPCEDELPCDEHDVRLFGSRRIKNKVKGDRYWCKQCGFAIRLEFLESYIEWRLLNEAGHRPLLEPRTVRGSDNSTDIIKLSRRIERLRIELNQEYDEDLAKSVQKAQDRVTELMERPQEPDRIKLVPVEPAVTIAEHWASLAGPKERNDYLRSTICTFYADSNGIVGQVGWMALDNPHSDFTALRKMMRQLKLPHADSWDDARKAIAWTGSLPRNIFC